MNTARMVSGKSWSSDVPGSIIPYAVEIDLSASPMIGNLTSMSFSPEHGGCDPRAQGRACTGEGDCRMKLAARAQGQPCTGKGDCRAEARRLTAGCAQ